MAKIYGRLSGEGGVRERVRLKVRRERRCLKWRGLNRVGRMGGQSPRQYLSLPHCPRLLSSDSLRMSQGCSKITLLEDSPPASQRSESSMNIFIMSTRNSGLWQRLGCLRRKGAVTLTTGSLWSESHPSEQTDVSKPGTGQYAR